MIGISATTGFTVSKNTTEASDIGFVTSDYQTQAYLDLTYVGSVDVDGYTGLRTGSGFFYANASGAYVITVGGTTSQTTYDNNVTRTTIDNTGGSVANTSVILGTLAVGVAAQCTVFDEGNRTFYVMCGKTPAETNMVQAFCLDNNTGWDTGCNMPVTDDFLSSQGIWYNETAFAFGDESWTGNIYAYKPGNNTAWIYDTLTTYSPNNPGTAYKGSGDVCYLFGGYITGPTCSDKIVAYNFTNKTDWQVGTMTRGICENIHAIYNDVNNTYILGPGDDAAVAIKNISEFNSTTGIDTNISWFSDGGSPYAGWDGRANNKTVYFFCGATDVNSIYSFEIGPAGGGSGESVYTLKGLPNDYITWSGIAGATVYCNSTGDTNEWLEINMSINATDNVTEIRVFMDDLNDTDAWINASNITMYVSSDNSSYGELGTFTDGGSNLSINATNWNAGTMGADPFAGAGLTDKNTSIFCIFKLTIPADSPTDEFYSSATDSCKIYLGHFV